MKVKCRIKSAKCPRTVDEYCSYYIFYSNDTAVEAFCSKGRQEEEKASYDRNRSASGKDGRET